MTTTAPYRQGYLDGYLGFPLASTDDAYTLGYFKGQETAR